MLQSQLKAKAAPFLFRGFGRFFLDKIRWQVLNVIMSYFLFIVLNPVLLRIVGDSGFGTIKIWEGLILQLSVVTVAGIGTALMQIHSSYPDEKKVVLFRTALLISMGTAVIISFGLLFIVSLTNSLLGDGEPLWHAIAFSFALVTVSFHQTGMQWLAANLRIGKAAAASLTMTTLRFLSLPLGFVGGVTGVGVAYALSGAASGAVAFRSALRPSVAWFDLELAKRLIPISFLMTVENLAASTLRVGDRYIIGTQFGSKQVAIMYIALSTAFLFAEPIQLFSTLLLPYVAARRELDSFSHSRLRLFFFSGFVVAGIVYGFGWATGRWVVSVLYGTSKWTQTSLFFNGCLAAVSLNCFYIYFRGFIVRFCPPKTQFAISFLVGCTYIIAAISLINSSGLLAIPQALTIAYGLQAMLSAAIFLKLVRAHGISIVQEIKQA